MATLKFVALALCFLFAGQDVRSLEQNHPVEHEISSGETHSYQITLAQGQYLAVAVEQRGIDVGVQVMGPDGNLLMEFNFETRKEGRENVEQVAETTGIYRLNVQAKGGKDAARYEIRVVELRTATEKDRALQGARKLSVESVRLYRGGKYDEARPLAEQVLEIREKQLGLEHPLVATALNNLAAIWLVKGDFDKAEPLYLRAAVIWEKAFGPEHPDIAHSLNNLAILYSQKGEYAKAEPMFQRAVTIREKAFGPDHISVAQSLSNLAGLYTEKGDYQKAEPLLKRALSIQEKSLGPENPGIVRSLSNLANIYTYTGDYEKGVLFNQRALAIKEKTFGPDHPEVGLSLSNLADCYYRTGDVEKAMQLSQRALAIKEKSLGPEHPETAVSLSSLAILYQTRGDYEKAESLFERALAINEKALGPEHPNVANCLHDLSGLFAAKGDIDQAVAFQVRASTVYERNVASNLSTGSDRQKLAYLATLSQRADQTISLYLRYALNNPTARKLAATTVLRRKGRALDAVMDSFATLRRRFNTEDQALLDQLRDSRAQLATLVLGGPQKGSTAEHLKQIKALEDEKENLENNISRRSAEFRAGSQPITLEAIQSAIPVDAALVEFTVYHPFNAKYAKPDEKLGKPRYAAFVLNHQGESRWVDLGEAKAIDDAVDSLRRALRDPKREDIKALAQSLDEKVMRPVRALLGTSNRVLLSPDSALNLVPFAALVDEQNRYLVERYEFSYLTSGSDLLRLQAKIPSKQVPLIVTNPDFGARGSAGGERRIEHTSEPSTSALRKFFFRPLPATMSEGEALRSLLPGAKLLTGNQATEGALKQVSGPMILHIATHGFFLDNLKAEKTAENEGAMSIENPLLRSGVALAGANKQAKEEDGILTAEEVASLDLWGTKLVALSACDTGVGEIKTGDGVHGLRRALVLAGSESQVMSLWPVSDKGTRDLMIGYYKALESGKGRSAALREVQLQMLKRKDRQHPYYWASFIESGEWANLEGKR
jgi:CHAT domain-containing protein/Tfp pilus assembly protein PilF